MAPQSNSVPGTKPPGLLPERATLVCSKLGLDVVASPQYREGITAQQFLGALIDSESLTDAVTFLCCALPKREAVWWGCCCVRARLQESLDQPDATALAAAVGWVREPSEENRRAAKAAADTTEYATPAGLAALAAFFADGSMAPPDIEPVPPPEHLAAQTLRGAIMLAAVSQAPEQAQETYRQFLALGLDVALRKLRWDQPEAQ